MNEASLNRLYLRDTAFQDLMQKRVFNVLLIASPYDAFMIEEDGRIEEQLFFEYVALNLSSPPRVTQARNYASAMEKLAEKHFDLIIAIPNVDINPIRPKQWSPCRWVMKMAVILLKFTCAFLTCIWVPSPQSTMNVLSLTSIICEDEKCLKVGNALPHPNICTLKGCISALHASFRRCYTLFI